MVIVLAFRLSFPLATAPSEWDSAAARQRMRFKEFLERLCRHGSNSEEDGKKEGSEFAITMPKKAMGVFSAMKVVLEVLLKKYDKRVAALERQEQGRRQAEASLAADSQAGQGWMAADEMVLDTSMAGCPMMDGSMAQYVPMWDAPFPDITAAAMAAPPAPGASSLSSSSTAPSVPASASGSGTFSSSSSGATSNLPPGDMYHDLWATMTMGWAAEGMDEIDFGDVDLVVS